MRRIIICFALVLTQIVLQSCEGAQTERLTLAVASNMQFAVTELSNMFSEKTGVECEVIVGSSGKLTAQILEGAPFDLLLSADMFYPQKLHEAGFSEGQPQTYAQGKLILLTLNQKINPSFDALNQKDIKFIAVGNPQTAPYGKAAQQALENMGLEQKLEEKLVYGESISQTNQFILSQVADIGFTSKSVAMSERVLGKGRWIEVNDTLHDPILQGVVVIDSERSELTDAIRFRDFLFSEEAKSILEKYGYNTMH